MNLRWIVVFGALAVSSGCSLLPRPVHQPTVHNPFPQLSRIAIAPFFNLSREATLDGRQVANAYFNELQLVPGFEVVPVGVVEQAMIDGHLQLKGPEEARRLAQILQVDAVVIGAVTDYSPYYPPRFGLQVEWYAANPCFHPIPPGYGLPWGTAEEQQIPAPLALEAQFALAKEQLKTQTPKPPGNGELNGASAGDGGASLGSAVAAGAAVTAATAGAVAGFPADWPDPRGFVPPPPQSQPPTCWPSDAPVIRHTRTYNGNDADFTAALSSYYSFRDEARFDGWQGYLQRSDDFIRFCCHMHVWEALTARGGAGETRVVWRWPSIR